MDHDLSDLAEYCWYCQSVYPINRRQWSSSTSKHTTSTPYARSKLMGMPNTSKSTMDIRTWYMPTILLGTPRYFMYIGHQTPSTDAGAPRTVTSFGMFNVNWCFNTLLTRLWMSSTRGTSPHRLTGGTWRLRDHLVLHVSIFAGSVVSYRTVTF